MTLEQWSYVMSIVGSVGVIISLVFVGLQIRENTAALQRNEHNSTMEQWTVIRQAIARDANVAKLMTDGLRSKRPLRAADQLRLEMMLNEYAWAAFHIWDRTQRGIFPPGTFEATGGALFRKVLNTPRGAAWWQNAKTADGFYPAYVKDMDAMLTTGK
ncbi:MAG: hypothetical protein ACM3ZT_04305 [Bacillota bacterium]